MELRHFDYEYSSISFTEEIFKFEDTTYTSSCNTQRYNKLCEIMTEDVYGWLLNKGLTRKPLDSDRKSFIWMSENSSDKLLILIHGAGDVRAGQWSRKLIIYKSVYFGSQWLYVEKAIDSGFDVLVTNGNENPSVRPETHANYVWKQYVTPSKTWKQVTIVAHSYGGVVTVNLAKNNANFQTLVKRVVFLDSVHKFNVNDKGDARALAILKPVSYFADGKNMCNGLICCANPILTVLTFNNSTDHTQLCNLNTPGKYI